MLHELNDVYPFLYSVSLVIDGKVLVRSIDGIFQICNIDKRVTEIISVIYRRHNYMIVLTKHEGRKDIYMDEIYLKEELL